jgi:hypothetical protein
MGRPLRSPKGIVEKPIRFPTTPLTQYEMVLEIETQPYLMCIAAADYRPPRATR